MFQQLAVKPNDLSSIPRTHMVDREKQLQQGGKGRHSAWFLYSVYSWVDYFSMSITCSPLPPPPPTGHPPTLPLLGSTMEDGTQFWSLLTSLKCHPLYDLFEVKANHGDRKSYLVLKRDELWGNGKTQKWENKEKKWPSGIHSIWIQLYEILGKPMEMGRATKIGGGAVEMKGEL